ncbi:MAG: STN domain-containing protein [Acidobacteriota bacterium]
MMEHEDARDLDRNRDEEAHDAVAEALRQAGPRPELSALGLEGLSTEELAAPARAAWEARLARRARGRRALARALALAAVLALAALGLALLRSGPKPTATVLASLAEEPAGPGQAEAWPPGAPIAYGSALATAADPPLWLSLQVGAHRLRLDAASELLLLSPSRVELLRGRLYVEAGPEPLEVLAAGTVSEHVGTHYEVQVENGEARVRVRDGVVRLLRGQEKLEISRGQAGLATPAGLTLTATPVRGESWGWIRHAAPPFILEGSDLASFLGWFEAETGFEVEVAQELLTDEDGKPIRLRGALGAMAPREALDAVLAGTSLRSEIRGDRVLIFRAARP